MTKGIYKKIFGMVCAVAILAVPVLGACGGDRGSGTDVPPEDEAEEYVPEKTVTETRLVTYDGPSPMTSSEKVSVKAEGTELFVYDTRVNHTRSFTYVAPSSYNQVVCFDFEGKITIEVTVNGAETLSDVTVRPLSYGVVPEVSGNTVTFSLEYTGNYVLEYNDGTVTDAADNALHIFANPIEEDPVDPDNLPENTVYIGPGVYSAGAIPLTDGCTLYLAGGAYVYGNIRCDGLDNITVRGRGILSGEIYSRTKASEYTLPIELQNCTNVTIEGITILDPAGWAITLYFCDEVEVDNVKIITARANGDGISVQSSKNVTVTGGFVRTWDDSLVVKNTDMGTTSDILFDGVTVWTDLAQSMEVGYETYGAYMRGITFTNITVLHNYHKAVMSLHNSDNAEISNVTYSNITLEDGEMLGDNRYDGDSDYLIDFTVAYSSEWTQSGGNRGSVTGVLVDNLKVLELADTVVCRINGESATSMVRDVTIRNVEIEGKRISDADGLKLYTNAFTGGVTVLEGGREEVNGAAVRLPYILDLSAGNAAKITVIPTRQQSGLEVPDFAIMDVGETYMGVKLETSGITVSATHGTGDRVSDAYDDGSGEWQTEGHPAGNLFDGDRGTSWEAGEWTYEDDEFIALTFDFGGIVSPCVVRIYLDEHSSYITNFDISVNTKATEENQNFALSLSRATYEASPASGNYFDIRLSSTLTCAQMQLRIYRTEGMTYQGSVTINEIVFYPCSLSTTKSVEASDYYDVYTPSNIVDGNTNTYWESATADGAYVSVDLGEIYDVKYIVMHLPALLSWDARVQEITIYTSTDGENWSVAKEKTSYLFDPATGNSNTVEFDVSVSTRYVKLVWSSNSAKGGYGAQLSELYVYGE